ncbi:MAG: signal peptidase I [Eubacteriales bacterium]|nr:signal peptidase I [Eubacteriales bacterium]
MFVRHRKKKAVEPRSEPQTEGVEVLPVELEASSRAQEEPPVEPEEASPQPATEEAKQDPRRRKYIADIRAFLIRLALLAVVLWITFGVIFGVDLMRDNSMFPRISAGDLLIYYRMGSNFHTSDVLIFEKDGQTYVGRLIASPGDSVEVRQTGELVINESIVLENNVFYKTLPYAQQVDYPLQLAADEYFVLCDFREGPKDSRYFGAVKKGEIKGKVFTIFRRSEL